MHDTESKSSFFVLLSKNIIKRCLLSYEFLFWALAPVSAYSSVLNMAFFLEMLSMLFLGYSFGQRHYRLSLSFLFVLSSQVNTSRSSYRDAAIESTTIHSATSLQRNRFLSSLLLIFLTVYKCSVLRNIGYYYSIQFKPIWEKEFWRCVGDFLQYPVTQLDRQMIPAFGLIRLIHV